MNDLIVACSLFRWEPTSVPPARRIRLWHPQLALTVWGQWPKKHFLRGL